MMEKHFSSWSKTATVCCVFSVFFFVHTIAQVATPPSGMGSSVDPYEIATWQNLYWISQNSAEWGKHYLQTADIDLATADPPITAWDANKGWTPIGSYINWNNISPFTGSYDGGGHTISGLFINRSSNGQGLFGFTMHATIKNLGVIGVSLTNSTSYTGSLVGLNDEGSSIINCYSSGTVSAPGDFSRWVGGLVGQNNNYSTISNCYSSCNTNAEQYVGGLVGSNEGYSSINNCYATGSVEGRANWYNNYGYSYAGGLVGRNFANVTNSYSTGAVIGKSYIGGLIGESSVSVAHSFWDMETSGISPGWNPAGTGKTTLQMKEYATFYSEGGWDFMDETLNGAENHWGLNPAVNNGYPFLSFQGFTHDPDYIVITLAASNVSFSSVSLNGAAEDLTITEHGFCWNTSENPTVDNSKVEFGAVTTAGNYSFNLNGLDPNTLFYYRAFAVKGGETFYGYQKSFKTSLWTGHGTPSVPYQITNTTDLKNLSENSEWWAFHFIQTADIAFIPADFESGGDFYNSGEGFIPIGSDDWSSIEFSGSYNGDGHTITGLFINRPDDWDQGFFGHTDGAAVKNLGLINVNITGNGQVGGLIGWAIFTDISNCYVTGIITASTDGWGIGGLVGYGSSISVIKCYTSGTVTVSGNGVWDIGGLIGYLEKGYSNPNPSTVTDSHADVDVNGEGDVGGLVGYSDSYCTYTNCYATGNVTGTYTGDTYYWSRTFVGVLIGNSYECTYTNCHATGNVLTYGGGAGGFIGGTIYDMITNCFATGSVKSVDLNGNSYVGGFAGMSYSSNLSHTSAIGQVEGHFYVGGLLGLAEDGLIEYSFAKGNVITDEGTAGGLVGDNKRSSIQYCYANGNVSGPTGDNQTGWDIGGLVGWNQDGVISNSYATGNVVGYGEVGGLLGASWSGSPTAPFLAKITNCYSVGNVTGIDPLYAGGLAGRNRGAIDYCHWDIETSGTTTGIGHTDIPGGSSIGTTSNTTTEMKTQSTFTDSGWDFTDTWAINPFLNNGYPYLGWQDCFNPADGGTISASQTICAETSPNQLTSQTLPSGYLGTIEYKWQMTTVSQVITWNDISNSNEENYQPGSLSETTWFRRLARTCTEVWNDAAASNDVEINIEATPVAGTLSKTPDAANFCDGDDVSATLTSGAGGNGADELEYRTKDGSVWSDWENYTSGNKISTTGFKGVEIRTRRTAEYCNDSDYETASWTIPEISNLTVRVNITATKAPNGQVLFKATPVNGGDKPYYKWYKIHGSTKTLLAEGENVDEVLSTCKSGDEHWVELTSSIPCTATATSNAMCSY